MTIHPAPERQPNSPKAAVRSFWDHAPCGEAYASGDDLRSQLAAQAQARYQLEPYIPDFARFQDGRSLDVLEIGVGMGADHLEWARAAPRSLTGVDLTPKAVELTRQRLALEGLHSNLLVADAEALPLPDSSFDIVYSYGVLHHSPNTAQAFREVHRVLRPGGQARIMIYHRWSWVGAMLWARYAMLAAKPWRSLDDIYAEHLESPGTKAYSRKEARALCDEFASVELELQLGPGDLLEGVAGQRHGGLMLTMAKRLWPRRLIRLAPNLGLFLLIRASK